MTFEAPMIDDRTFEKIFEDARARIAVHNPEWTNHNDADPGITMLQLFSFITENMLFRANKVPDRNRLKFLSLLGMSRLEGAPARGFVTFRTPRSRPVVAQLAPDTELRAGKIPFGTTSGLEVLPVEGRVFYKAEPEGVVDEDELDHLYGELFGTLGASERNVYYETRPFEPPTSASVDHGLDLAVDTVDDTAWLALLAPTAPDVATMRARIAHARLSVGFAPAVIDSGQTLAPLGSPPRIELEFRLPDPTPLGDDPQSRRANWVEVPTRLLGTYEEGAIVEITLPEADLITTWDALAPAEEGTGDFPPALEDEQVADRVVTWIRIRLRTNRVAARFSWIGINATRVIQRGHVSAEVIGRGNGEPDQRFALANTPVIESSVTIEVDGTPWTRTDDLQAAPREAWSPTDDERASAARVFTIDRATGALAFGDGVHGARPPQRALIVARYDYGGGVAGNVGIGAIGGGPALPAGFKVTNPLPTEGGTEPETQLEAERRIPARLRHRERLVSIADYHDIVLATPGVQLGRFDILPLFDPDAPGVRADGAVTVLVVPAFDRAQPRAPRPDQPFLQAVCRHLDPRRLVTTELHVVGPEYVRVWVSIGVELIPRFDTTEVTTAIEATIRTFLSPIEGGFPEATSGRGSGWPLERDVDRAELAAVAARVPGVAKVTRILLDGPSSSDVERVTITGRQLPYLQQVAARDGVPLPIEDLRGGRVPGAPPTETPTTLRPVPIPPREC